MTTYRRQNTDYDEKDFIDRVERIDITDYVQTFLLGFRKKHGIALKINHQGEAEYLKKLLSVPENRICSPLETENGFFYWNTQKVDFVPSNLKKGYLFYFVCIYCDQRVKYLYRHRTYNQPSCRTCCKLGYVPPSRKTRSLSRLARKPYFSSEDRYWIAKRVGITEADIN